MAYASRLIGMFMLVFGIVFLASSGAGGVELFVNVPTMAMVGGIFVFGLMASFRLSLIARAFAAAMCEGKEVQIDKYPQYAAVLDRAHQLAWVGGFLTTLIGWVQLVSTLEDPSQMEWGLGILSLSLLYGAVLAEVFVGSLRHSLIASYLGAGGDSAKLPATHRRTVVGFVATACCFVLAMVLLWFMVTQNLSLTDAIRSPEILEVLEQ